MCVYAVHYGLHADLHTKVGVFLSNKEIVNILRYSVRPEHKKRHPRTQNIDLQHGFPVNFPRW